MKQYGDHWSVDTPQLRRHCVYFVCAHAFGHAPGEKGSFLSFIMIRPHVLEKCYRGIADYCKRMSSARVPLRSFFLAFLALF